MGKKACSVAITFALCSFALVSCNRRPEATPVATGESAPAAAPAPAPVPASGLAGTHWRLVEVQSMDDAIGTTRPDDPELYTLAFGDDGSLAMRLNCNRGSGAWKATPDASGQSGSIAIGPLAVTRALCPPPSLDERIARDMHAVRSYLLRDGRLSLSLAADAGIYLWAPEGDSEPGKPRAPAPDRP